MDIKELDGNYQVSVMADGSGAYSQNNVLVQHTIENGIITGTDSYGVKHSGKLSLVDKDHVAFSITIEPPKNAEVVTTLESGLLTDQAQTINGTYKISRKDGQIMLTTMQEHGATTGIITCRKI